MSILDTDAQAIKRIDDCIKEIALTEFFCCIENN